MYELLELSIYKIAKECRITGVTIQRWLKKFNIKRRTQNEAIKGKNNPNWKGDDVKNLSVRAIHIRIVKVKPKPTDGKCDICHKVKDKYSHTKLQLSNIKNHQYTLKPDDYQWIHISCHRKYDVKGAWSSKRRKEQAKKMREISKRPMTPKRKKEISIRMKRDNPMKRPEIVEKRRKTMEKNKANKSKKTINPEVINSGQINYWLK